MPWIVVKINDMFETVVAVVLKGSGKVGGRGWWMAGVEFSWVLNIFCLVCITEYELMCVLVSDCMSWNPSQRKSIEIN